MVENNTMIGTAERVLDLDALNRSAAARMYNVKCAELARANRRIRQLEAELAAYEAAASGYIEVSGRTIARRACGWKQELQTLA